MTPDREPPIHRRGDVLAGRYRLVAPLAEGGMGSVWSAHSLALDVDVAVKVVKRGVSSPDACERLLREARAAASLAHASIVRVLDFGTTEDGEPFLVMQLLHGKTLGRWLRERRRLPAATAVGLVLPIASALAEVHALGIVHRDIKPENIILEEGPGTSLVPKLVDFGIAKQSHVEASCFTGSGVLIGSPAYMSPEQARGDPHIDARSDVWSLSVVLYEMITGKRPFEGPNHGAILFAVFADAPEPTHVQGAGDEALWEILRRGLAKTKAERWPSMIDLGHALAAWAAERGVTADATGASITHHWLSQGGLRAVHVEQPTTEVPRAPRPAKPADLRGQLDTLSSSPLASEAQPPDLDMGTRARSRSPVLRLGGAVLVLTSILTFLVVTAGAPGAGRTSAGAPVPASVAIAAILPAPKPSALPVVPASKPSVLPVVPAATAAPTAASGAHPAGVPTSKGRGSPLPGRAGSRVPPRPGSGKASMPLPAGPDF